MSANKKVRLAIFGIGHNHAAAAIKTLKEREDIEIAGFCEPDERMLAQRIKENPGVYGDIPQMSESELFALSPDAAIVEAAVPQLTQTAMRCARQGLNIYMDKPGDRILSEYEKLLRLIESNSLLFRTGYMYRYNAGVRYALEKAKSGELGRIYNITGTMSTKHPEWFKKQLISYGVPAPEMFIFGCHLIDLCLYLKGEPQSLSVFHSSSGDGGIEMADTSLAVLSYTDGIAQLRVSSVEINGWGMREFTVYGEKGMVSVSPIENRMRVRETTLAEQQPWKDVFREVPLTVTGRYTPIFDEFIASIKGEKKRENDLRHEYLLQKLTLSASGINTEETK